jgi:hypothetical protein
MKKTAVTLHPGVEYPPGRLAGYGGRGYDVSMDNPDLAYGGEYHVPQSPDMPDWVAPAGIIAGGLAGIMALRGLGRRLASRAVRPKPVWNWEAEMLGRGPSGQSLLHEGEALGRGYGPGVEDIVKRGSVQTLLALGRIANER